MIDPTNSRPTRAPLAQIPSEVEPESQPLQQPLEPAREAPLILALRWQAPAQVTSGQQLLASQLDLVSEAELASWCLNQQFVLDMLLDQHLHEFDGMEPASPDFVHARARTTSLVTELCVSK